MRINKIILTITLISGMILFFCQCFTGRKEDEKDSRGNAYAGSISCLKCHQTIYNNYQHTAHYFTSRPFTDLPENMLLKDSFVFNENTQVSVEKRDSGVFQVAYENGREVMAKHFDIAFGSGEKAFSFGYWQGKRLYQLPLSYFDAIDGWANSPGFPARRPNFNRLIIGRCFECHSSYIAEDAEQTESLSEARNLDKKSIIYGIDCERCHGPAASHVDFHTENPGVKEAQHMVRWKSLSRQQKLDACGVCHSGNDLATQQSTFSFVPGDTLSQFYYPAFAATPLADVHGKQVQLLAGSACFKMSSMDCSSCHNTHMAGPEDLEIYSRQCVSCHKATDHKTLPADFSDQALISNCIDCHMPKKSSGAISYQATGSQQLSAYLLRTHRIAIYPEESQKIITKIKELKVKQ